MKRAIFGVLYLASTFFFLVNTHATPSPDMKPYTVLPEFRRDGPQNLFACLPDSINPQIENPALSRLPIQFSGYVHIRYQHFDQKGSYDAFDIHRVRLKMKGSITSKWSYKIQVELSGKGAPKLIDAMGEWKWATYFIFRIGQFYIPLSLESLTPDNIQESIYRAQMVEALANRNKDITGDNNGRDIGAQVSGSILKVNNAYLLDYKLAVFNGAGINVTADNNNFKDIAGRLVFHPLTAVDFGVSLYHGYAYYGFTASNYVHNRQGCDLAVKIADLNIKAEYLQGKDSSNISRSGYYVQAGYYIIPRVVEVLLKCDSYNSNLNKATNYFTDITTGLGYNFAKFSRLQAAYIIRREQGPQIRNNFAVARFQFGF